MERKTLLHLRLPFQNLRSTKPIAFVHAGLQRAHDIVLPPRCPITGKLVGAQGTLDPTVWGALHFMRDISQCACCGKPFAHDVSEGTLCTPCLHTPPAFDCARAAMIYDDVSAKLILKFKHADGTHLMPLLTHLLIGAGHAMVSQADILVPVPLHRWRLLKRRYNQAALLSNALAKHFKKEHLAHGLRRVRATESQGRKNAAQRFDNVARAFIVADKARKRIEGKRVILVDDVLTSGATVSHCARALREAGAISVEVLTLARVR